MAEENKFLEIECKYNGDDINRITFKDLVKSLNPKSFIYVESKDVYYIRQENEFLRYRMAAENKLAGEDEHRSELTFKKKHIDQNNWIRTEVNLRIDRNTPELVMAFCEGLGYSKNFSIDKACDIYFFDDADIVYYTVKNEDGKYATFVEIEADENIGMTPVQAWEVILKYEKLLAPLGITAQKRKRLSLFEIYKR